MAIVPWLCGCDFECVNFKHSVCIDILGMHVNITKDWIKDDIFLLLVNICPGNSLLPDGTKPLPEAMLTNIFDAM